ncbi:MAG TPA: FtsX-like permease family protein, partial [Candidatus Parabacteroides intestinavium]|nr:FtsX-like permease family protein [Candidatus Parabacteroides intestinavium]
LVDTYTYMRPLGFDTNNVYVVNVGKHTETTDSVQRTQTGENFIELTERLRQCPEVEAAGIGKYSCPYLATNAYSVLVRENDTLTITQDNMMSNIYHQLVVDLEYFRVFRIQTKEGKPLADELLHSQGTITISADMEKKFFGTESGVGKKVKYNKNDLTGETIAAVTTPIRYNEFEDGEERYYYLMRTDKDWIDRMKNLDIGHFQCFIRMKNGFDPKNIDAFLQRQSERLEVGNLYISNIQPVNDFRDSALKNRIDNQKKKIALVSFMMANIFFGIVGTFWLRTQSRRAEIGLRSALGASKSRLRGQLYGEGLLLLLLTLPIAIIYMANMLYLDMPDTDRLAYTGWRFFTTFGATYLVLGLMIYLGISIPAGKITRMNPADTLHYE